MRWHPPYLWECPNNLFKVLFRYKEAKTQGQLLAAFSHTTATYGRTLFQRAQPYRLRNLDPFRAAVTGSDTKAHRPQSCRPFRVNPDCRFGNVLTAPLPPELA